MNGLNDLPLKYHIKNHTETHKKPYISPLLSRPLIFVPMSTIPTRVESVQKSRQRLKSLSAADFLKQSLTNEAFAN